MNFEELLKHVTTRDLLKSASAAGHLPIYLYAYPAEQEDNIAGQIAGFASNLTKSGITLLHRDLFDVTVEVLKEDGSFDKLIEVEPKRDKYKIVKHISNVADVEKVIIPRLINEISGNSASLLLLSGFGKCYPFLRAKQLIGALEQKVKDFPVILFFPGTYDGWSLMLFGELPEHSYRAINLSGKTFNP